MTSPSSSACRGSTTEPDTPQPETRSADGIFAKLIPINRPARSALGATLAAGREDYHRDFVRETVFNGRNEFCFQLSLSHLPQFAHLGWRIGRGRRGLQNRGVDLLLLTDETDDVAGIHARLNWVKGAGGFFLIADNRRGRQVMLNAELFCNDRRLIPFQNTIMVGECLFTLEYARRSREEEEQFQVELAEFYKKFHQEDNPLILPTPSERDVRFGEWVVQYAISKGSFGVVYMVTHARTGRPAAAKQILRSNRNRTKVDQEIDMARCISRLRHERIASPFDIHHQKTLTKVEVARIKALLDDTWQPSSFNNITDEFIIFSPLLTATFRSLFHSNVSHANRSIFFAELLDAVAFLHEHGICHRDIKPDNVLVRRYDPPDAMLSDFGSASDAEKILYDWPGTIPYLAPEQVEGQYHGHAVDYWACALVGMELIGSGPYKVRRILPGPDLVQCQKWLQKSSSAIGFVCRAMLEAEPQSRMTAEAARTYLEKSRDQMPEDGRKFEESAVSNKRRKQYP